MKAIIMAGGEGTRLRPLTCDNPKPMMPVIGKPVMEHIINLLKGAGICEIGVTLSYLPIKIKEYFGNGEKFGVKLHYFIEEHPLGTAGSVKLAEEFLDESFIVIAGDSITNLNLETAISFHMEKKAVASIILKEISNPLEYGVVITDDSGRVKRFQEKPSMEELVSNKVNTGIYIFEPEILKLYPSDERYDFSKDLFPILMRKGMRFFASVQKGYWCDIGCSGQYLKCNLDALSREIDLGVGTKAGESGIYIGKNVHIDAGVKLNPPVFIDDGCKIYENATIGPFTSIGKNSIISSGSKVERSIIFSKCYIGRNAELKGTILAEGVEVEKRAGIYEGSVIGSQTFISKGSIINPGIKIWPHKIIHKNEHVKNNIVWDEVRSKKVFLKGSISGEGNLEITPEFISKLGTAIGSFLSPNDIVAVCTDYNDYAKTSKHCLIAGLRSISINILDFNEKPLCDFRYGICVSSAKLGVYIGITDEIITINIFDSKGISIEEAEFRSIERAITTEDYRRVPISKLGKILDNSEYISSYKNSIKGIVRNKDTNINVLCKCPNDGLENYMREIMESVGNKIDIVGSKESVDAIIKKVKSGRYDFAIIFNDTGDSIKLINQNGEFIKYNELQGIQVLISLHYSRSKIVLAPNIVSLIAQKICKMYKAVIVKDSISSNLLKKGIAEYGTMGLIYYLGNEHLNLSDNIKFLCCLTTFLSEEEIKLEDIIEVFPQYKCKRSKIVCPFNNTGLVMDRLFKQFRNEIISLNKGFIINMNNGYAYILADADEPFLNVYVESETENGTNIIISSLEKIIYSNINVG